MTPIFLVDELIKFIQPVVAHFELQTNVENAPAKAPQVISGYLQEKKPGHKQDPPDFPHVIVRYLEDNDTEESSLGQVRIIVGTYSEDEQNGWRDSINVITRIKEALLEKRFIGRAFNIEKPIKTELPEEQPYPEWVAMMTVSVTMPQAQQEIDWEKEVF